MALHVRRRLAFWGCGSALVVAVAFVALVVILAVIAKDPVGVAERIKYALGEVGDGITAVLRAPIHFFGSLVTFIEHL